MHAHRAIWARRMMIRDWYNLNAEDRLLHAGAQLDLYAWHRFGGSVERWGNRPDPEPNVDLKLLPLLARHDATLFAAAPGVIRKLNTALPDQFRIPKLRHVLSAGEKLSPDVRSTWRMARVLICMRPLACPNVRHSSPLPPLPSADHALGGRNVGAGFPCVRLMTQLKRPIWVRKASLPFIRMIRD